MNYPKLGYQKLLIFIFLIIVPLLSANIDYKPNEAHWSILPIALIGHGIQNSYFRVSSGVRGTTQAYLNLVKTNQKNKFLKNENQKLKTQLTELGELELENQRLRRLLNFKEKTGLNLLAAQIIASNLSSEHNTLIINKGYKDGVVKNMAAITPGGVIGYIIESLPRTSKVLLITDRYIVVDGLIQNTRSRGTIEGHSKDLCRITHLDNSAKVTVGDLVVTSGQHKIFPKGLPIGQIISVKKDKHKLKREVLVKPAINPYITEELFIVLEQNPGDTQPLSPNPTSTSSEVDQ